MKKNKMLKKVGLAFVLAISFLSSKSFVDIHANGNTQVVNRNVSYAYPETGEAVDGGTNIALGDSMANSIIDPEVLVEQMNGRTYVTLGFDLMSNIRYVKVKIQKNGKDSYQNFQEVPIELVGSCVRQDTCNHYRFEVSSTSNYISPVIFVEPMGREVQFFIKLNMASARPGRGNFDHENSKPAESNKVETSKPNNENASSKPKDSSKSNPIVKSSKSENAEKQDTSDNRESTKDSEKEEKTKKEKAHEKQDTQNKKKTSELKNTKKTDKKDTKKKKQNTGLWIGIGIVSIVIIAGASVVLYKKRKG